MKKHSIVAVAAVGAAVSLALSGCSGSTSPGSSSSSSSSGGAAGASVPVVKLMVGGIDKQIYLPYQLAENLGYYAKYGVKVELSTEGNGGVGAEDAMLSGSVDLSGAWYNHAPELQAKGQKVVNLVQLSGAPGEREMCRADAGIKTAADFKGKNLGVTDLGSGTDKLTQFLAAQAGISRSQYTTVAVHAGSTAIAALQRKQVDCVMTTQPTVGAMEAKGVAVSTVDLASTAGAKAALGGAWPAAGLLAKQSWVDSHKDAVQKVVTALVATMQWISTHTAQDIADKLPQSFVQNSTISKAAYVSALEKDKGQFLPDGIMPAGGPKTIYAMEKAIGTDVSKVPYTDTFTQEYAQNALKTLGVTATTTPAGSAG